MPLINEDDLISQGALNRPKELGDALDRVYVALTKILKSAKESEAAIISSKSTSKVATETGKLTKAQKDLAREQEKSAKIAKVLWLSQNEVAQSQKRAADSAKQLGTVTSELDKKMASVANTATAYGKAQKESNTQSTKATQIYKAEAGSLNELIQKRNQLKNAIAAQKKDQAEDVQLMKQGVINRAELNKRITESEAIIAKNNVGIQNLNRAIKNHMLTNTALGGEYQKLTIQMEAARNKYKDLAASGTASNKVLEEQKRVFEDLYKKVTTIDKAVGQFQRNVGNYPGTFGAATESIRSFVGAFGIVTGIALFAKTIKEVIAFNAEFERQNSRLQGILGATKDQIKVLRDQQIALGESTAFMSTEYAQLQIELAKLGFPIDDIEKMTESTANAAIALGAELGPQAELTGSTMRAFGLSARDAAEVNDQLAKSTASSALSFEKLSYGLPYVAASANKLGFSLNETLALMGELANQGLQASTIGTSLRSIFLKLSDSSSELSKKFKEPVRDLPSLLKGLKQLSDEGTDLGEALELTDVRSVTAFASLIKGADSVEKLSETIENANGFAKQLADTVRDNLSGDFILLTSAGQELARQLGESVDGALRKVVQTATVFVKLLIGLPQFIKENKVEFIALAVAIAGFNSKAIIAAATTLAMELNTKRLIIQQRLATVSTRALTAALLANPIGLIAVGFAAAAVAISAYDRNSKRALEVEKQRKAFNKDVEKQTKSIAEAYDKLKISADSWLKMSDKEKESFVEKQRVTLAYLKASLLVLESRRQDIAATARQLTLWQQIKGGIISAYGGPAAAAVQNFVDSELNAIEATQGMTDQTDKLKNDIEDLSKALIDNTNDINENNKAKAQADKEAELKRKKAQLELDKFRLEQEAKVQQEIIDNEKATIDERISASLRLQNIRFKIAETERKKDLLAEDLNAGQIVLINEQAEAAKTDAAKKGKSERDKLNEDEIKKQIALAEKRIELEKEAGKLTTEAHLEAIKQRSENEVKAIQEAALAGRITRSQADKQILEAQRKASRELINEEIAALEARLDNETNTYYAEKKKLIEQSYIDEAEKILKIQELEAQSEEEKLVIRQRIHALRMQLTQDEYDNVTNKFQDEIDSLTAVQEAYDAYAQAINEIYANIHAKRIQDLQAESDANAAKLERDLKLAGDNEAAKDRIKEEAAKKEEALERKRRQEARKAAVLEKALGLVSAAIKTSIAVLHQLGSGDPYTAFARAAAAGALGAIQIAAIATKPIPAYEKGTAFAPETGPALVGEKGAEMMISPKGEVSLTPDVPTIMEVSRGTKIIPHQETIRKLALGALTSNGGSQERNSTNDPALLQEMQSINRNLSKIKPTKTNLIRSGASLVLAIEDKKGHTKLMRGINLGKWF